jgi:hypothetical protein
LADAEFAARVGAAPARPDDRGDVVDGRVRAAWDGPDGGDAATVEVERPTTNFSSVGGLENVKDECG